MTITVNVTGDISVVPSDGINPQVVLASAYGATPDAADIGPCFANMPRDSIIWFVPGVYKVVTYPTESAFSNKFYRGIGVEWHCQTALPDLNTAAFTWSYTPATSFGTDTDGGNLNDLPNAGLSPIEGIAIYGNSQSLGIGLQIDGSSGSAYFLRPKNFAIQNFGVGFQYKQPMANCFLTGLENVVLKSNGTNVIVDNRGSSNSGENFCFKSCYIGNASVIGAAVYNAQLVTFDGCSFDYNKQQGYFSNAEVKLKNCYIEGSPGTAPAANWFQVNGISILDIDQTCNIFMLGGTQAQMDGYDFFGFDQAGSATPPIIRCNASFFSTPQRQKPLNSAWPLAITGSLLRCNGSYYPGIVSESVNLFPDVRATANDMALFPGSVGVTYGTPPSSLPNTGSNSAFVFTPTSSTGASLVFNKMSVHPGKELYAQWFELTSAQLAAAKTLVCKFYTADNILIPNSVFFNPATFSTTIPADSLETWTPRNINMGIVPAGAAFAQITLEVAPYVAGDSGLLYVGNIYVFE